MRHDLQLCAAARGIYDACYPSDDWVALRFEQAERYSTIHYRQAVEAAPVARACLAEQDNQLSLF